MYEVLIGIYLSTAGNGKSFMTVECRAKYTKNTTHPLNIYQKAYIIAKYKYVLYDTISSKNGKLRI